MKHILLFLVCISFSTFVKAQESIVHYLSGTGADNTVTWDFYCTDGSKSKQWNTIEVPSCWEQQGYGEYNYGHVPIDKRLKEEGYYKFEFDVNRAWKNQNVDLVFEGVMTDCEVILNGKVIGVHQGAFYEFAFDVSKVLKYEEKNLLEVKVKKHSKNESINQAERKADYWIFGGIFRPVYLQINPQQHISRVAIDAKADGAFKADVLLIGRKTATKVEVSIFDFQKNKKAVFTENIAKKTDSIRVEGVFENPKLWSSEFPNRYIATFKLLDKSNRVLHELTKKIGFRTVEVREADGIYVNGAKTKFRGVNSHTFHPDYGRTSSETLSIQTVNTMKDMNMNAIRFSHYPHDKHLLNACDSLGLFVLDELAGWQRPSYDTKVGRKLLREMIRRDVNNPSIILWDNGNEGGWNTNYDHYFAQLDIQKREVLHPWGSFGKTNTAHYIDYDYLTFDHFAKRQIFFPTEFLHGLYDGGHGAGLDDYWQKMWDHPLCAGGFLWVLSDEAIKRTDTGRFDTDGNHAPDGIVGPYFEKEGSFYTIKKIWSPIQLEEKYITSQFNGKLSIENRFQFTNLSSCHFDYRWIEYTSKGQKKILSKGLPIVPDLKPLEKSIIEIPLDKNLSSADALEIVATDPFGRHIYTWSYAVSKPHNTAISIINSSDSEKLNFSENNSEFIFVANNGTTIIIGKNDGLLKSVSTEDGLIPFTNGPIIIYNELKINQVTHVKDGELHRIKVAFEKDKHVFEWILEPSGLLRLNLKYEPSRSSFLAGIDFSFPETEIEKIKWMGNGPYRVWKNRLKGVEFGVWEKDYNNTITGHSEYKYPEFKGYHSNMHWLDVSLRGGQVFRVYTETKELFFKLFNPEEAPNPMRTEVSHSKGDISFMNGIPAIGTKFTSVEKLGLQSQPYKFIPKRVSGGKLSISLIFDFKNSHLLNK